MPVQPEWMRVEAPRQRKSGITPKVDFAQATINRVVLAEEGKFKDGRGFFNEKSIAALSRLATESSNGIKSRLSHPNMSDDGLSKFLGRFNSFNVEDGKLLGNFKFNPAAAISPHGDMADYVMTRAKSDPESFGMSVVAKFDWFNAEGKQIDNSEMLTAWDKEPGTVLWVANELHAADVVDSGNATSSFFSMDGMSWDAVPRQVTEALDTVFAGEDREVVEGRCSAFLSKYLNNRFGDSEMSTNTEPGTAPVSTQEPVKTETVVISAPVATAQTVTTETPAPTEPVIDVHAAELAASTNANNRAIEVAQLCQLAKCPERTAEFLSPNEAGLHLSMAQIRAELLQSTGSGNVVSDHVHGVSSVGKSTEEQKLDAEYDEAPEVYEQLGISRENYHKYAPAA